MKPSTSIRNSRKSVRWQLPQTSVYEILDYQTAEGRDPFTEWLKYLPNRKARARVMERIGRMKKGHFGDYKILQDGVCELRIDYGPGYRVYYARAGKQLILLLAGGDKHRQQADIDAAVARWNDWKRRNGK
jgi:putative addiction module killer protein